MVKHATAKNHEETELLLLPTLTSIRNSMAYARVLTMFYGYFFPVERQVQQYIMPSDLADIEHRRNAGNILADLSALGLQARNLPLCTSLPTITNKAQAFGALYVLEGSTLGGKMIAKMLRKNSAFPVPETALTFFEGYGAGTGNKWKTFLEVLNQQQEKEEIIETANETFAQLKSWMQHCFQHE